MIEANRLIVLLKDTQEKSFEEIVEELKKDFLLPEDGNINILLRLVKTCYYLTKEEEVSEEDKQRLVRFEVIQRMKEKANNETMEECAKKIVASLKNIGLIEEQKEEVEAIQDIKKIYQDYQERQQKRRKEKQQKKFEYRQSEKGIGRAFEQGRTIQEIEETLKQQGIRIGKEVILNKLWQYCQTNPSLPFSKEELIFKNGMMSGETIEEMAEEFGFKQKRLETIALRLEQVVPEKQIDIQMVLQWIMSSSKQIDKDNANLFRNWGKRLKGKTLGSGEIDSLRLPYSEKQAEFTYLFSHFERETGVKLEEYDINVIHSLRSQLGKRVDRYLTIVKKEQEKRAYQIQESSSLDKKKDFPDGRE